MAASGETRTVRIGRELDGEPLRRNEIGALRAALNAAGLPAEDIAAPGVRLFRFARDGRTVGYGGMEIHGAHALLRSIVVDAGKRRKGVGREIVDWLLLRASRLGAPHAFLFATDSRAWFEKLGFRGMDRSQAPQSIRETRQAQGLCSASAVLMMRTLTPDDAAAREAQS